MRLLSVICGIFLSTIIIGSILVPTIIPPDNGESNTWQYDDYSEALGAQSASGAFELITIGGTSFIHAKSVGEGTIQYADHTETVTVSKANLDVLFIMGQSNGEYLTQYAKPAEANPVPKLGTAYYYGTEEAPTIKTYDKTECAMRPMVDSPGESKVGDIWPSLAASYTAHSNVKAYVVSAAWGGKSITTFEPPSGDIWTYTKQVLSDSLEAVDTDLFIPSLKGYIWIQGEADENMPEAQYIEMFEEMNAAIFAGDLGVNTITDCFISKVRTERAPVIAQAEIKIAETIPHVFMACQLADGFTYDNGYRADYSHYTQAGDNLIGAAVGKYIAEYYYPNHDPLEDYRGLLFATVSIIIVAMAVAAVKVITIRND